MNAADTNKPSQTNWDRVDAMADKDIDLSDCPELTDEWFAECPSITACVSQAETKEDAVENPRGDPADSGGGRRWN